MRYLIVLLLLSGCATTYHAERISDGTTTLLDVKSYREFPGGIEIVYNRETGQFELSAGDVQNGDDAIRDVVLGLLPLIGDKP